MQIKADGGIDYNEYDIDPAELEFGPQDKRNSWKDSTNNRRNHLKQLNDSDLWVCYRTWQTGPNEYSSAIKGIGKFSVEAVDLDTEFMADYIRNEAEAIAEYPEDEELGKELIENAEELATEVEEQWAAGVGEIVSDSAYEGYLNIDGTYAWVGHVEEAYSHEVKWALSDCDIEDNDAGRGSEIVREALSDAVRKHRDRYRNPHAEYIGRLSFEIEPWQLRAIELQQNGGFPYKTSRVVALNEVESYKQDVAERLEVNPSTVTRHLDRANRIMEESRWNVRNVEL